MKTNIRIVLTFVFAASVLAFSACNKKTKDAVAVNQPLPPIPPNGTPVGDMPQPPADPPPAEEPVKNDDGRPKGTVRDLSGLDGCKWVIITDEGTRVNPTNIADFNILLKDGMRVYIEYVMLDGVMTTCMSGKVSKITLLEEVK